VVWSRSKCRAIVGRLWPCRRAAVMATARASADTPLRSALRRTSGVVLEAAAAALIEVHSSPTDPGTWAPGVRRS
jgi:hypothetical protein